jgi:hypothetical protein
LKPWSSNLKQGIDTVTKNITSFFHKTTTTANDDTNNNNKEEAEDISDSDIPPPLYDEASQQIVLSSVHIKRETTVVNSQGSSPSSIQGSLELRSSQVMIDEEEVIDLENIDSITASQQQQILQDINYQRKGKEEDQILPCVSL